jgi:4-carboxymuconolactone decarboxylase
MSGEPTLQERLDVLNAIVRSRGYAHASHRLLANHDLAVLKAVNGVTLANYVAERTLSERVKELALIAAFTCLQASGSIIAAHVRKALAAGASPAETFEAVAHCLVEAGRVAFDKGLSAWLAASGGAGPDAPAVPASDRPSHSLPSREIDMNDGHDLLARVDAPLAAAVAALSAALEEPGRALEERVRHIVATIVLVCVGAGEDRIERRMRAALSAGVSSRELLEALELIITPAGLPVFDQGLTVWARVTGAPALVPEVSAPNSEARDIAPG